MTCKYDKTCKHEFEPTFVSPCNDCKHHFARVEESEFQKAVRAYLNRPSTAWDEINKFSATSDLRTVWNTALGLAKGVVDRGGTDAGMASRIADLKEPE